MNQQKQRLLIMIFAGIFGLLILVGVGFAIFQSQKGKVVIAKLTPQDATVKLDGAEIKKGTHYVEPGKHKFEISRTAFKNRTQEFEIQAGETQNFDLYTAPDGDAGLQWAEQNPEEASELDGYMSREYEAASQRIVDSNEIFKDLPIMDAGFRIDHGLSEKGRDFALYIQSDDDAGKQAAIDTLVYMGYDPTKYEIIYTKPE